MSSGESAFLRGSSPRPGLVGPVGLTFKGKDNLYKVLIFGADQNVMSHPGPGGSFQPTRFNKALNHHFFMVMRWGPKLIMGEGAIF